MPLLKTLLLLACLLALPSESLAHRVNLFAYVDGSDIVADCFYSKSSKVMGGSLRVTNAATGEEYARLTTDAQGMARFPVPPGAVAARADLKLVLVAGEGHQVEELVRAPEFAHLSKAAAPAAKTAAPPEPKPAASKAAKATSDAPAKVAAAQTPAAPAPTALDEAALARIVEAAVDKSLEGKLAPVKRLLTENVKSGPGPTEIVGGIGYIVGLFGVAAFVAARRKNGKDS